MPTVRRLGAVLAGVGLLAIVVLTLVPNPRQTRVADQTPLLCLVCGETGGADVVHNLLLFMPLAAGLVLLGWPWARVVAVCALLSLGVETLQYAAHTGRDASLSDLLTNTTSAALGAALARRRDLLYAPGPRLAGRLSLGAAAAWLGLLGFTAVVMRPWAPGGRLWNYCTASFPTSEAFSGTARTMTLNGVGLACDREVPRGEIRREIRRGHVRLETVAEAGEPSLGRRAIHLVRASGTTLVVLAQHGRTASFQGPTAAQALRLFTPAVRLSGAFPSQPGSPVELTGEVDGHRLRLSAADGDGRRAVDLALSPSYGWTLLFPIPLGPGTPLRIAAAIWLGALLLPAGYWGGLADRQVGALAAVGAVVMVGLGLVPSLSGFEPVHWSEWLGAGGAIAVGWALSRMARYLQSRCGSPSISAYSSS
jgi:VanZ like protein